MAALPNSVQHTLPAAQVLYKMDMDMDFLSKKSMAELKSMPFDSLYEGVQRQAQMSHNLLQDFRFPVPQLPPVADYSKQRHGALPAPTSNIRRHKVRNVRDVSDATGVSRAVACLLFTTHIARGGRLRPEMGMVMACSQGMGPVIGTFQAWHQVVALLVSSPPHLSLKGARHGAHA